MVDQDNPPPPSGETFETGKWDKSGVAPKWKRNKFHQPYTKHLPSALVAGVVALVVSLLTNSMSAGRSETFQIEQEQRGRIEVVRADINELLNAIEVEDDAAVEIAVQSVDTSSTFLPVYRSLLRPLRMTISGKQSDVISHEFLSIDPESGEKTEVDQSEVAKIQSEGWRKIRWQAMRVRSKLLLATDPYTLECQLGEICQQLDF